MGGDQQAYRMYKNLAIAKFLLQTMRSWGGGIKYYIYTFRKKKKEEKNKYDRL